MARQAGLVLLSLVLFTLLLSSAVSGLLLQRIENDSFYVAVVANSIVNRQNLLRSAVKQLGQWPTAAQLQQYQQSHPVIWSFELEPQQPGRWRLALSRPQWQKPLIKQVAGSVVGDYWVSSEPLPSLPD